MKCCTPVVNRRRVTASVSPKRIQSSCAQAGEKNSPKKVKLGLQPPATPAALSRIKASPVLCHPVHLHFSSTPKGQAQKGHLGPQEWPGCSSLIKGTPRAGASTKKMTEDPSLHSEKNPVGKGFVARTAGGQRERPRVKCLKVQPVQKELISRVDFSLSDTDQPLVRMKEGGRLFAEQCAAAWAGLPAHQKDREQHLRLYHQQFQQPPILQQKLSYQPLERFLDRYKPQEVQVREEPPCQTPLSPQDCDEMMQLEDLDDSDFSEDSFSPGSSQKKVELKAKRQYSQGSFFLHRRECGIEGLEVQGEQELFSRESELEDKRREVLSGMEEAVGRGEDCKSQLDRCTEASTALDSSPKNDMPEKPYCSQDENVVCNSISKESLPRPKQPRCTDLPLNCPSKRLSVPEKAAQSPPFAHLLASASCISDGLAEESLQGKHAPLSEAARKKCPHKGTDLDGALNCLVDFTGEMTPLTVSLLNTDTPAEEHSPPGQRKILHEEEKSDQEEKSVHPRKRWDEGPRWSHGNQTSPISNGHEMDHWRRTAGPGLSPQAKAKWLSQPYHLTNMSSVLVESALSELEGCVYRYPSGATGLTDLLSPCTKKEDEEDTLLLSNLQFSDFVTSPQYDADTERTRTSLNLGKEESTKPIAQLKHLDVVGKPFILEASSISDNARSKRPPEESISLQSSLTLRKGELDSSEDAFTLTFSSKQMALQSKEALGR